jgi:hypothetical protein
LTEDEAGSRLQEGEVPRWSIHAISKLLGFDGKRVWLADVPKDRPECRSPFFDENSDLSGIWLERPPGRLHL